MSKSSMQSSSPVLIVRLSIMMFLQFFIWGAWYVSMNGFLGQAGMSGSQEGLTFSYLAAAYTVAPIAAILAPLTLGLIADRFINTEWVLAILSIVGAALLWVVPNLAEAGAPSTAFGQFTHPMILVLLLYMLCFMPTLGLTASLSFKHLANGEKEFPIVRVLGTIGWIAGNWAMWGCRLFVGEDGQATFADDSGNIFRAAAIASAVLGVYCLTLPKTVPPAKGESISIGKILGVDAWSMLKDPWFLVFAIASFLICIPLAGYYAFGYGYVDHMGIKLFDSTTGAMSTGQMSEIFFMLIMPLCFARLGAKNMLIIGMLAWVVRYGLWGFAFGQEGPLMTAPIFIGILLHGICYDFFFVTGMIYTDKKAPDAVKGQAQSLVVMLTQGLGLGIGAQVFGAWMVDRTKPITDEVINSIPRVEALVPTGAETYVDYTWFWYAPAIFAAAVMIFFALSFWDRSDTSEAKA